MPTLMEIEELVHQLPKGEREQVILNLLQSPSDLGENEEQGYAEAMRRDAEMDADPANYISFEEMDQRIKDRRK